MSVVGAAKSEAERLRRRKSKRVGGVNVEATNIGKFLKQFPIELRHKVLTKGVRKATAVVRTAARQKVASIVSKEPGTRAQQSAEVKKKREGVKTLKQSVGNKVKQYNSIVYGTVGARYGRGWGGSLSHLLEYGGVFPRWGKTRTYQPPRPFMRPASQQTLQQQKDAVVGTLKKEWTKV